MPNSLSCLKKADIAMAKERASGLAGTVTEIYAIRAGTVKGKNRDMEWLVQEWTAVVKGAI